MMRRLCAAIVSCWIVCVSLAAYADDLPEVETRSQPSWERGTSRSLESRVSALERKLSGDGLQLIDRIEALQQEVQNLRGLVEEQQHALELMRQQRVQVPAAPASSPRQAESKYIAPPTEPIEEQPIASVPSTRAESIATTPVEVERQLYEDAYSLLQSRQYQPALEQLQALIKRFPNGQYTVSAQYWLGEVLLVQGKVDQAENAFQQIVTQYPKHAKTGDALLKLGYVACAKGNYAKAKDIFTQVKTRYPDTPTARLAEARLQRMKQDGQI